MAILVRKHLDETAWMETNKKLEKNGTFLSQLKSYVKRPKLAKNWLYR